MSDSRLQVQFIKILKSHIHTQFSITDKLTNIIFSIQMKISIRITSRTFSCMRIFFKIVIVDEKLSKVILCHDKNVINSLILDQITLRNFLYMILPFSLETTKYYLFVFCQFNENHVRTNVIPSLKDIKIRDSRKKTKKKVYKKIKFWWDSSPSALLKINYINDNPSNKRYVRWRRVMKRYRFHGKQFMSVSMSILHDPSLHI